MTAQSRPYDESLSLSAARQIDDVCDRFEQQFRAGNGPRIESSLEDWTGDDAVRPALFRALLAVELELRKARGEQPATHDYAERFAAHPGLIADAFASAPTQPATGVAVATPHPDLIPTTDQPAPGRPGPAATATATATWVSADHNAGGGGRFRVTRYFRGGGLGDIYIAVDTELDREVALKEIKATLADEPDKRARFVFEAEVTGGLEHPSIVPVYGRGQYDNGRQYYAMRLIRGETLQEAITRFHRADVEPPDRDPTERALALRELLSRFLDVCDAIHYAHHRGVLHRDLKPGNILLGRFGETLVGDWGLARLIDRVAEPDAVEQEPMLRPASASGTGKTLGGNAIGTIGFMPPEQAEGRLEQLGPASDVYSLGAILYMLLTGQASIRSGRDYAQAIADIAAGHFPAPRAVNPRVPPALEAVCLKAMATLPAGRYATARALADEVKHWLADEPVSAYRERWSQRLARWTRRHRVWVQATAAALALVTVVSLLAAVTVTRAYRSEQRARKQSEADFDAARRGAIATYGLASRDLAAIANSEAARERLARYAAESYDSLLASRPGDRKLRLEAARADRETANLRRLLGRYPDARASDDRAVAKLRSLVAGAPEDREPRDALALSLADLGGLLATMGRLDQALQVLGESSTLARTLRTAAPDDLRYIRTEAFALLNLAAAEHDAGNHAGAQRSGEQALRLWSALVASPRANPLTDPVSAVRAQALIAAALREQNDTSGARKAYEQALAAAEQRAAKYPGNSDTLALLAGVRIGLADLLADTEPERARELLFGAVKSLTTLVRSRPLVPAFRHSLAAGYYGLGAAQLAAGQTAPAASACRDAQTRLEALLKERDIPGYHYSLGRTLANQARTLRTAVDRQQARSLYDQAIAEHERALALSPKSALDLKYRQRCREERAALEVQPDAAAPAAVPPIRTAPEHPR